MVQRKKYHSAAAKQAANRLKSLKHYHRNKSKINEKRRVEPLVVDSRDLYLLPSPKKEPIKYQMKMLEKLCMGTYQIFTATGEKPRSYHKYVAMLFKHFMQELEIGGTFHYLDPFLPPLTNLEREVDGVYNFVLKLSGPTSEDLAQLGDLQQMLRHAVLAIEELQMRCIGGGREELEWRHKNHLLRFQAPGHFREFL